jgi:hypothetical protein
MACLCGWALLASALEARKYCLFTNGERNQPKIKKKRKQKWRKKSEKMGIFLNT